MDSWLLGQSLPMLSGIIINMDVFEFDHMCRQFSIGFHSSLRLGSQKVGFRQVTSDVLIYLNEFESWFNNFTNGSGNMLEYV